MQNKNSTKISTNELEIMAILWEKNAERGGMPASEIQEQLTDVKDWSPRTINTMLARLVNKSIVESVPDGRRYLYKPLVTKREYTDRSTGSLIDRLFDGRTAPLVAHLVKSRNFSPSEVQELQDVLDDLKKKGGK